MEPCNDGVGKNGAWPGCDDLVRLAQQGDLQQAWEGVKRRTQPCVVPFVTSLARKLRLPRAAVDDALQIADKAIREVLGYFDPARRNGQEDPCHFELLLRQAIWRRVLNFRRGWKRFESHHDRDRDVLEAADSAGAGRTARAEQDPAQLAIKNEERARLEHALVQLSEERRTVLERHFLNEEPLTHIAEDLGQPYMKLYKLVQRTLKQLRSQLAEPEDDAG
jgi:RNA polymerase sigma factor (sigma-70 family)